jgi:hypothetical protein
MEAKERGKIFDTPTDPSLEFDTFEYMRSRLTDAFVEGGHAPIEDAKIALYVVQSVRHVPKLLRLFTVEKTPTLDEILDALGPVLDEAPTLEKVGSAVGRGLGIAGGIMLGGAVGSIFVPGVGAVLAAGGLAAALLGTGGAAFGATAGGALDEAAAANLRHDELHL